MARSARAKASEPTVIYDPQPKQQAFIACPADDIGFGGARGGGKSYAVVGDFIDHEETYGKDAVALAFRRERTQLIELIETSKQVLNLLGYKWHEQDKYFRGPKGGRLRFSYLENDSDADAYQGHSYSRLYPEEMGTFPNEAPIAKLMATLRSGNGVPCQLKGTCNPGGPGHQWVKRRYGIDTHPLGYHLFEFEYENPYTKKKIKKNRIFIPSKITDNKFLGDDYVANLFQVGSPNLVKAWLNGDWNVIEGAFFPEFSIEKHVIPPFAIPEHWLRFRSMDWGSASPFSVGWWAVVGDDHRPRNGGALLAGAGSIGDGGQQAGILHDFNGRPHSVSLPRGALVRYREWYGADKQGHGLKLTAEEIAEGIKAKELNDPKDSISYGVLDPSAFSSDGGPSIAERMARAGVWFRPADNRRVARLGAIGGWDQLRNRLIGSDDTPMIYFFSTCIDSIRTLPALQHDPDRPEDVDTESEDHAPDEIRYACMSRPYIKDLQVPKKSKILAIGPGNEVSLDDLWEANESKVKREGRI